MTRLVVAVAVVLAIAPADTAVAKETETPQAVLLTTIPLDAGEGTAIRIAWRIRMLDGTYSHGHVGAFARLVAPSGEATEGFSSPTRDPQQPYETGLSVPRGGITRVEFGVAVMAQGARSDVLFPMKAVRTHHDVRPVGPMAVAPPRNASRDASALLVIAVLLALIVAASAQPMVSARRRWK